MKGDSNTSRLLEVEPNSFAEDLSWFLSGVEDPCSLAELDPCTNSKTCQFFANDETAKAYKGGTDSLKMINADEQILDKKLLLLVDSIVKRVSDARQKWQNDMMDDLIDHEEEICEFATDLNYCDSTLRLVEEALLKHYKKLETASTSITNLYSESEELSLSLENRKMFLQELKKFLDDITIPPKVIEAICKEPIRFNYVQLLETYRMKAEKIKSEYDKLDYPALNPCKIQLKKLELVIVRRIYDFMTTEIAKLTTPKANLQMIQNTYFLRMQPLYAFILETHSVYAGEIKNHYSKTMRKVYHHLFSNYYQSLDKFRMKNRYKELGVIMRRSSSRPQGYFFLEGRDKVCTSFQDDPMVPAGLQPESVRTEDIIKSFLKLLVDTASSEYIFIKRFFGKDNDAVFKYIFEETLGYLRTRIDSIRTTTYDVVMLTVVTLLIGANMQVLHGREIALLKEALGAMHMDVYQSVLSQTKALLEHVKQHTKHVASSTIETWLPGAYATNMGNMVSSLYVLKGLQSTLGIQPSGFEILDDIIMSLNTNVNLQCKKINHPIKGDIFIIANCSAFLSSLEGTSLKLDVVKNTLTQHVKSYVNGYLHTHFDEMIDQVTGIKVSVDHNQPVSGAKNDSSKQMSAVSPDTVAMWRKLCEDFNNKLPEKFRVIKAKVKVHFTQEYTVTLVLNGVIEAIEDAYNTLYCHLSKMIKPNDQVWMKNFAVPGTLLQLLMPAVP
ncbi:suppressor of actin mutations 2/vacuolar protein sorting 52 like protein [Babesia gibsoni]|uniref:Suppressor of actin mutations 2/vacuolar protein sorting 52 like protein n=1 Tax=Babesia gibsoni TaxID=33632 RepID=A0AAD8UTR6_BABGI|nr:suppressor of actin mutations 2/vacuolar protein sorting 52 like protein [Babesia gibsoni]